MKLFNSFIKKAPNKVFISIVLGALAGMSYALLIPIVLNAQEAPTDGLSIADKGIETFLTLDIANFQFAVLFFFSCLFILITRSISQVLLIQVSMDVTADLRKKIYNRIMKAPISALEKLGSSKLITAVTIDVGRIIMGARILPDVLINVVTLIGMLSFLLYLNNDVFWVVLGAIFFGAITYQIPLVIGNRYFDRSRSKSDDLQESIKGLIHGVKELKLNSLKREGYFEQVLLKNEESLIKLDKKAFTIVRIAMNYGDLISFFVIGMVSFIFVNYHSISSQELIGVIMAMLYITGPVSIILNSLPEIAVAKVSLRKVTTLFNQIPEEGAASEVKPLKPWDQVVFSNVNFRYNTDVGKMGFEVGPLNFTINKGEVTFIIGGNGSGKSTMSKLITLHYLPAQGQVLFGDQVVDLDSLSSCRETISAIFTDFYLFDQLHGIENDNIEQLVAEYLVELRLDKKVEFVDRKFSTLALSDGQRKRLALLVGFLEDKELYLFDEWAADQDPDFKEVFYHKMLPDLKARNKAVVVISHDDRYFDIADKIVVMEEGKILRQEYPGKDILTNKIDLPIVNKVLRE